MSTFLELQDQALHDDFDATKYRAAAKRLINEAQHRIFRTTRLAAGDSTATVTLAAGDSTYPLPANNVRVDSLHDTASGLELAPVDVDDFDALPTGAAGTPTVYAQIGSDLHLHPTPSVVGSLRLRYRLNPVDMAADGDTPSIPSDYQHLLVSYARSRLFRLEDDLQMAAEWWNVWLTDVAELRADLQRRGNRVRQVPGMWESGSSSCPKSVRP